MVRPSSDKYRSSPPLLLPDRKWPEARIRTSPRWLSTDLRDGNQSLPTPLSGTMKLQLFNLLLQLGFSEIEVGFPAASATEFEFVTNLIRSTMVPDDVQIQVLTPCRGELIRKTFRSLEGASSAIVHFYNALSPIWRETVFKAPADEVKKTAIEGAKIVRDEASKRPDTEWLFQYSPEAFSTTEPDFALEVCEAVMAVLSPSPPHPIILNLPTTVEASSPNQFADRIEYFIRNLPGRENAVISIHPHNDRGTGIATAELALLAGAQRVEGCLFGHGERAGNCCLIQLAENIAELGIDTGLHFNDRREIAAIVELLTGLPSQSCRIQRSSSPSKRNG